MDRLQTELFGNTLEDWIVSTAIFLSSLFLAKLVSRILRRVVSKWTNGEQRENGQQRATRLCTLITSAIPITGFALATNKLALEQDVSFWITNVLFVSSQIVFLLILVHALPSLVTIASKRHLNRVAKERLEYLDEQRQFVEAIKVHIRQLSVILLILVPLLTILSRIRVVPMAVWTLPAIVIIIKLAGCYRIILAAKRKLKESRAAEIKDHSPASLRFPAGERDSASLTKETVVVFFLNLFKHQLKVPEGTPSEFSRVDQEPYTNNEIYELRVKVGNDWRSRRMTIAPVGEEGGSRSECFYVIYDDRLVIKLPFDHIGNLSHYMDILRRDARIVDKLAMKECVIPRVSVTLKRVHAFPDQSHFTPLETEDRYMKWLAQSPGSQKYLKIGQDFAFFMDFSQYYFLQNIMDYIHDIKKQMYEEILSHSEIIRDLPALESNYGSQHLPVFLEIGKAFMEYEREVAKWLTRYELSSSVSPYQIRGWFFASLAAGQVTEIQGDFDPEFISHVNRLLTRVITTESEAMENYRKIVNASVSKRKLTQTKSSMEGLVTNLMELLATLGKRGVAMRDLKPDNLLVAGDPQRYPEFLASSDEYKIGLIDVETAAILGTSKLGQKEEPQLGGTPHYATPSHFFRNDVLQSLFKDVPRILHLQDWHAIVIIIYRVVTGNVLFENTAKLVPGIVETIENASDSVQDLCNIAQDVSQKFWGSAVKEFRTKMNKKAAMLKSVSVVIPKVAKPMLRRYILEERQKVAGAIEESVISQRIFRSEKNQQYLLSCSHENIVNLMKKYESGKGDKISQSTDRAGLIDLLENLGRLKLQLDRQIRMVDVLDQHTPTISGYALLEVMFHIVIAHMYRKEWRPAKGR